MAQDSDIEKERAITTAVEKEAQTLIERDIRTAEKPLPARRGTTGKRLTAEEARRQSRRMYGDDSVPRVRPERRYGGSSHSRAYLKQELCLYSDRAQTFFERNYESVNMSLIVCTLVTEAMGGEALAGKVSAYIEKRFSDLESEMLNAVKELERGATEGGIPKEKQIPAYDHKRWYNPPLHTPQSVQFMTVVVLFDRIVSRAEGCWINRLMDAQTRKNLVATWQKRLLDFVLDIYKIRDQARREARKAGFGRRAASIEENVRREHADEKLVKQDIKTTVADNTPEAAMQPEAEEASEKAPDSAPPAAQAPQAPAEAPAEPAPVAEAVESPQSDKPSATTGKSAEEPTPAGEPAV